MIKPTQTLSPLKSRASKGYSDILVELKPSRVHKGGVGVFAARRIQARERIAIGVSKKDYEKLISWKHFQEFSKEARKKIRTFCIGTAGGFLPPRNLDFNNLSFEWYLNHSC